ncbi:hypothetical protein H0V99_02245 [Candidatus Saccharibacteria bacterium]|nr:hypothetical protein [Candidatus Saccharibacteria bacterium]
MSYSKLPLTTKEARKKDALALAELIYDMYKEEEQREKGTIEDGQNNAQSTETN